MKQNKGFFRKTLLYYVVGIPVGSPQDRFRGVLSHSRRYILGRVYDIYFHRIDGMGEVVPAMPQSAQAKRQSQQRLPKMH